MIGLGFDKSISFVSLLYEKGWDGLHVQVCNDINVDYSSSAKQLKRQSKFQPILLLPWRNNKENVNIVFVLDFF